MIKRVSGMTMMSACHVCHPNSALALWVLEFLRNLWFPLPLFFPSPWPSLLSPNPTNIPLPLFVWKRIDPELFWCLCLSDAASARITDFFTKSSCVWCWGWSQDLIPASQALYPVVHPWPRELCCLHPHTGFLQCWSLSLVLIGSYGMLTWIFRSLSVFHYLLLRYSFPM